MEFAVLFSFLGGRVMEVSILILELIGTVAFSASGAMIGIRKNMD